MKDPAFKTLELALSQAEDWQAVRRAWEDSAMLQSALAGLLPKGLASLMLSVRRGNPTSGIRGSELVVLAKNTAAAAKLRLALSQAGAELSARGLGIQTIKVLAERAQSIDRAQQPVAPRDPIPETARARFSALAEQVQSESLRQALQRISR